MIVNNVVPVSLNINLFNLLSVVSGADVTVPYLDFAGRTNLDSVGVSAVSRSEVTSLAVDGSTTGDDEIVYVPEIYPNVLFDMLGIGRIHFAVAFGTITSDVKDRLWTTCNRNEQEKQT
ncbi:BnaA09g45120D [Brassica napus]|uniref:BnaA09g45120D protein n=2 Tax=Brassica TaxID=3705 RepID=A0A078G8Q1_BRANA|nr:BnaA09g45120D [Brassica napus]VDC63816.1 unnamed protein product [Brassica rapa]